MSAPATTSGEELRRLVLGYRVSQALYVAAELGVTVVERDPLPST
jgi:hypothetical protein